jgi:C-terminal processing protease CtpA/Prc
MDFANADLRLLGLFRFFSTINSFYPYKNLNESWNTLLQRMIPQMEQANTQLGYERVLLQLTAALNDSHAAVYPTPAFFESLGGHAILPIRARSVEGKTVITEVYDTSVGLRIGDVIDSIDGEPMEARLARLRPFVSESSPQAFGRAESRLFLFAFSGSRDRPAHVEVSDGSSNRVVDVPRSESVRRPPASAPPVRLLSNRIGYININQLAGDDLINILQPVMQTSAVVVDMRGYPLGNVVELGKLLSTASSAFATAVIDVPVVSGGEPAHTFSSVQTVSPPDPVLYHGKVWVLIDEETISQSEQICMMLRAGAAARFVGSASAGTNGNITQMVLPGSYHLIFTGLGVAWPNHDILQRKGIQPDLTVKPTLAGIRHGRDEILDVALAASTSAAN